MDIIWRVCQHWLLWQNFPVLFSVIIIFLWILKPISKALNCTEWTFRIIKEKHNPIKLCHLYQGTNIQRQELGEQLENDWNCINKYYFKKESLDNRFFKNVILSWGYWVKCSPYSYTLYRWNGCSVNYKVTKASIVEMFSSYIAWHCRWLSVIRGLIIQGKTNWSQKCSLVSTNSKVLDTSSSQWKISVPLIGYKNE